LIAKVWSGHILRKKMMKTLAAILTVLTVVSPGAAVAQTMYKCVQDGKTSFQGEPCPASAKQGTLKARGTAPVPVSAPASAPALAGAEFIGTIEVMSAYRACADGIQIWGQEMAGPYGEWRSRNVAMVSRVEKDKQLQTLYQHRVEAKRKGKARMCRDVALELRGKNQ
jgi:hypothetical protein